MRIWNGRKILVQPEVIDPYDKKSEDCLVGEIQYVNSGECNERKGKKCVTKVVKHPEENSRYIDSSDS